MARRTRSSFSRGPVSLAACGQDDTPLPDGVPGATRLSGVRFGLSPVELEELRSDVILDDEGIYREELEYATTVSYGFRPWDEGRPPHRRARLAGVEIRERAPSLRMLGRMWEEAVERATDPACTAATSFRLARWTATSLEPATGSARDSIRVTWIAEIITAGDGRGHEAYLSTRMETADFAERTGPEGGYGRGGHPSREERVECGDVSAEIRHRPMTGVTPG